MDMVTADFEGDEEEFIKEFNGWLDIQSLMDAVKHISPDISPSKFHSMSYGDLVGFLMFYLEIDDAKTVFLFCGEQAWYVIERHLYSVEETRYHSCHGERIC
jgi:hypothetical protein